MVYWFSYNLSLKRYIFSCKLGIYSILDEKSITTKRTITITYRNKRLWNCMVKSYGIIMNLGNKYLTFKLNKYNNCKEQYGTHEWFIICQKKYYLTCKNPKQKENFRKNYKMTKKMSSTKFFYTFKFPQVFALSWKNCNIWQHTFTIFLIWSHLN